MDHLPTELLYILMAAAGGLARVSHKMITNGPAPLMAIVHVGIATFSGFMFALFMAELGMMGNALILAAGLGGWLGTEVISYMTDRFTKR